MQGEWAFCVIRINSKTSPGALILREAWEVILRSKLALYFGINFVVVTADVHHMEDGESCEFGRHLVKELQFLPGEIIVLRIR